MHSHWKVFTNTNTSEKAIKVTGRLQRLLEREPISARAEPYHKGGHVVTFAITHEHAQWNDTVVDVLACAQTIGYGWTLHSSIEHEVDLVTTEASVAGIEMIHCTCARNHSLGAT